MKCGIVSLFLFVSFSAFAQVVDWREELVQDGLAGLDLGTADSRTSRDAVLGIDGETWVVGRKDDPGEDDFFIARFDAQGQRDFMYTIDLGGGENAGALLAADDGGVYASASSWLENGRVALHLMRFDADGNQVWVRSFQPLDDQASSRTTLVRNGDQVFMAYPVVDLDPPHDQRFEIAQTIDQGSDWQAGWQASYLVPDGNFEQVNLSIRPDGQRLAFSTLIWGSPFRHYLVLVNAANGAVAGSHEGSTNLQRVLEAAFTSDGSLRLATATNSTGAGSEDEIQLHRFSATAAHQGMTNWTCADDCRIDAMVVASDDASFVLGGETVGSNPEQVLGVRFDAAGAFAWAERYTVATSAHVVDAVADGTGVAVGVNARLEDNGSNIRYQAVGRIDAAGGLIAPGLVATESDNSELIAMHVDAGGVAHAAGSDTTSIGRVVVSQYPPGAEQASFIVDHGPAPTAVEVRRFGGLTLDQTGQPVVAFHSQFFQDLRVGLRAFDAAGNLRWQVTSDGVSSERESVVAATGTNELVWASRVGSGTSAQLGVRRIDADTGLASQLPQFVAEDGPQTLRTAGSASGDALVGASIADPAGIVLRLFGADGQPQWRTVVPNSDFPDLTDLGFLANGDPVAVYQPFPSFSARDIHIRRYDRVTGTAGTELTRIDTDFYDQIERVAVDGNRVYLVGSRWAVADGFDTRQMQVACFDFDSEAECWPAVLAAGTGEGFGIAVDAAAGRVYAAGVVDNGSGSEAVLLAVDNTDGSLSWQQSISGGAGRVGRDVFIRSGEAVLVAERLDAIIGHGDAAVLAGFTATGDPTFERTLTSGQRLQPETARYDPSTDRLYLHTDSARQAQLFTPTLLGIEMVSPDLIYSDRFELQ